MDKNNTCASLIHEPRKRRKDEEMTEVQGNVKLDWDWKQDEQDISIIIKLGPGDGDADKVDFSFTGRQMLIKLSDGRQQSWCLHAAIEEDKTRVRRKKRKFTITVVKKEPGLWPDLEASEDSAPADQQQARENMENGSTDNDSEVSDSLQEVRTKEEEPVMNLLHIKHGFFENVDTLSINIYVKNVSKDAVKIHFDKQSFTVKFQTGDAKFLQQHEGASEDTVFCWKVNTRNAIQPAGCKHKTTGSCIELTLKKASPGRWATLEAPLKRETSTTSKSTSWMPAKQNTTTQPARASTSAAEASAGSGSAVAFDEMSLMDDNRRDSDLADVSASASYTSASSKSQKPTAKVQPLNKQTEEVAVVQPGFTGLDNIGNTCFMSSVIQVLANTAELRDYFLGGQFQQEINRESGGQLAVCFGVLLKRLWKGTHRSTAPTKLKELISRKVTQFTGWAQHDAQEFLTYLLDNLHEDVNRVKKKVPVPIVEDTTSRPDHVIADEMWARYQKREDSFLIDLLYGQYRSRITCPNCGEVSSSFDPVPFLPLALPRNRKTVNVIFMWRDPQRKPVEFRIQLVRDSSVEHLTEVLSSKTGVKSKNMRVFEVKHSLFYRRFISTNDLTSVLPSDIIIVSEVLSSEVAGEEVVELEVIQRTMGAHQCPVRCAACRKESKGDLKLKRCTKCMKVGYCNQTCQRAHWQTHRSQCNLAPEPVGCPFYLSLPRSHCTYSCIARLMESFSRYSVNIFQPPVKTEPTTPTTPVPTTAITTTPTTTTSTTTTTTTSSSLPGSSGGSMLPPNDLHLPSHTSASNLSSSSGSQSSGSLNSLDSISSCSSTATLTAETSHATFDISHSGEEDEKEEDESRPSSQAEHGAGDVDSGVGSMSSLQQCGTGSQASSYSGAGGDSGRESGNDRDEAAASSADKNTSGSNVQSVAATTSLERSVPLFFIKPVTSEGRGIREMDRLDDKGDTVLDMSQYSCLSMDWRNIEKQPSYVLVESKTLDADQDDSVKNSSRVNDNLNLQQCLEHYHAPEILNNTNEWKCTTCKKKQAAMKQYSLWRLPHILIFQLKRFAHFSLFQNKISKMVEFPIKGLDMSPYMSHYEPGDPPALYDLYGVINHHGGVLGGHYTCFARCPDPSSEQKNEVGWRLFDDNHVTVVSESDIVRSEAYVLFYRRRAVFSPPDRPLAVVEAVEDQKEEEVVEKDKEEKSQLENKADSVCDLNKSDTVYADADVKDSSDEKRDLEKDEDESEGSEDRLVIDMESDQTLPLDYTDINAVD